MKWLQFSGHAFCRSVKIVIMYFFYKLSLNVKGLMILNFIRAHICIFQVESTVIVFLI